MLISETNTPETPPAGKATLYFTYDGKPAYVSDDAQTERIPNMTEQTAAIAAAVATSAGTAHQKTDDVVLPANKAVYIGPAATLGSWRMIISDTSLIFARLELVGESNTWVTKQTISA